MCKCNVTNCDHVQGCEQSIGGMYTCIHFFMKFLIFKIHKFSLEYLIISLHLQMYIFNVKMIDNMHKSEVSVTDYQIHSTLHWIYNTVTEERKGDVKNQITLTEYNLYFYAFDF